MTVEVRLMGRFAVVCDGHEVAESAYGGRKVRVLLRLLATRPGRFVPNDVLAEALWPDRMPAAPAANLQVLVNRARRAIGRPEVIHTGSGGYALETTGCTVDTETFLAAVARATSLADYRAALAPFAEPLPEDTYADWAQPYITQVLRARQHAWERAAALAIDAGEADLGVVYASAAADADPLREIAVLTLARALAAAGDRAAALGRFDAYRRALADGLGLDPSPEAEALHRELLVPPPTVTWSAPNFEVLPFVGREGEVSEAAAGLRAGVVRIAGRSGSGKSRLLAAVRAAAPGVAVAASWADREEPWSLARVLLRAVLAAGAGVQGLPPRLRDALADLLPELDPPAGAMTAETRNALVIEGIGRLLAGLSERVVLIDDLQWADPSSLRLVAALAGRTGLVLAYRPGELSAETAELVSRLPGLPPIYLGALPENALRALVADPELAAVLGDATDRTPMAVTEVLRILHAECLIEPGSGGWRAMPGAVPRAAEVGRAGQRRVIAGRAAAHPGPARTVLALLALLGRAASARTLADAAGLAQGEVLALLDRLAEADLVRLGEGGWRTAHDMVAEVVGAELGDGTRGWLHAQLAAVLDVEGADAAERARHWLGGGDTARAADAYALAATDALDQCADAEAERLSRTGLAAVGPDQRAWAPLLKARAQARRRQGDIAGARDDLKAVLGGHVTGPARSGVLAELAALDSGAADLRQAAALAELALVEAGDDDRAQACALEIAAVLDMNLGHPERSAERSARALALFTRVGDSRGAARIQDAQAMATFLHIGVATGVAELDRAACLFEACGDLMRMVTPRSTCGHGRILLGRAADGLADADRALEVARALGHPEGQSYALWHRSEALSALGDPERALTEGRAALALAERLGHRGWTATAWRAIGLAHSAAGDPPAALAAFRRSLDHSANLDLFACWAAARAALACVALDELAEAAEFVKQALLPGPALGRHEARWAAAALAVARADPAAPDLLRAAATTAEAAGARIYLPELTTLAARLEHG